MITQEQIAIVLKCLPHQFSIDELVDKLTLVEKIERGLAQVAAGEVYTTEEAKQLLKDWSR